MLKYNIEKTLCQAKKEADLLGIMLRVNSSDFIDDSHLDCFWYGGSIGMIEYNGWKVAVEVNGDVFLSGIINGKEVDYRNKQNSGAWNHDICEIIKSDQSLHNYIAEGKLYYENNNWVEWNLIDPHGNFYDMGLAADNIMEDNVLSAFTNLKAYIDIIEAYRKAGA